MIGQLNDFIGIGGDIHTQGPTEVTLVDQHGVELDFHTLVTHATDVGGNGTETRGPRKRTRENHIFRDIVVVVGLDGQGVEQCKFKTHVEFVSRLPAKVCGGQGRRSETGHTGVAGSSVNTLCRIVAHILVTRGTVTQADGKVVEPVLRGGHELFSGKTILGAYRPECTPTGVFAETRRTVATDTGRNIIAAVVVIFDVSEIRGQGSVGTSGIPGGFGGVGDIRQGGRGEVITAHVRGVFVEALGFLTHQDVEVVLSDGGHPVDGVGDVEVGDGFVGNLRQTAHTLALRIHHFRPYVIFAQLVVIDTDL